MPEMRLRSRPAVLNGGMPVTSVAGRYLALGVAGTTPPERVSATIRCPVRSS